MKVFPSGLRRYVVASSVIAAFFIATLVLSLFVVHVDGAVLASGEITVADGLEVISSSRDGVVQEVLVSNGDLVYAGEIVARMDDSLVSTQLRGNDDLTRHLEATVARSQALINGEVSLGERPEDMPTAVWDAEQQLLDSTLRTAELDRVAIREQIAASGAQLDGAKSTRTQLRSIRAGLLADLELAVYTASPLESGLRQQWREANIEVARIDAEIASLEAQIRSESGALEQIDVDIAATAAAELTDALTQLEELDGTHAVMEVMLDEHVVRATTPGTVTNLTARPGSFAQAGVPLMQIVPGNGGVQARLFVAPNDIDDVSAGQLVRLNITSLTNRGSPDLWGTVDVVAAAPFSTTSGLAFFEVTVNLDATNLPPLVVGMPVSAYLQTGSRSLFEYLFAPIRERLGTALTEP